MRHRTRAAAAASLVLVATLAGCASLGQKPYSPHPGSASTFDSIAYDGLLEAQAAIDQAKTDYQTLSPKEAAYQKPLLNRVIEVYNTAQASWHTYHDATAGAQHRNLAQLQGQLNLDLQTLTAAIGTLQKVKGRSVAPASQ